MTRDRPLSGRIRFAAVVTPCTASKTVVADKSLNAEILKPSRQSAVAAKWLAQLRGQVPVAAASSLYNGNGFERVRLVAESANIPMYIASAGLGLVNGRTRIPAYNLTVSAGAPSSITRLTSDKFEYNEWWKSVRTTRYSSSFVKLGGETGKGLILVVLTQQYARLIGSELAELPQVVMRRLRIFGASLESYLPKAISAYVLPYDSRLDQLICGPKVDFAHRALQHFVSGILTDTAFPEELSSQQEWVRTSMSKVRRPKKVERTRATDDQVIQLIRTFIKRGLGEGKSLRALRDEHKTSCEQRRFSILYKRERGNSK